MGGWLAKANATVDKHAIHVEKDAVHVEKHAFHVEKGAVQVPVQVNVSCFQKYLFHEVLGITDDKISEINITDFI